MNEINKCHTSRATLKGCIINASAKLFITHGIKSVTMDDVASALTISKRTLYEVFPDKETLLVEVVKHGQQQADVYMSKVMAESKNVLEVLLRHFKYSIECFHSTNPRFFEEMKKYPKAFDLITNRSRKDADKAIKFFHAGVEQGIFRSDINFAIIDLLMQEQFNLLLHSDICRQYSFLEVYESIMFTHLRGISTEQGSRELEDFITEYRREYEKPMADQ